MFGVVIIGAGVVVADDDVVVAGAVAVVFTSNCPSVARVCIVPTDLTERKCPESCTVGPNPVPVKLD